MANKGPIVDADYKQQIDEARKELRTLIINQNAAPIVLRLAFHDAGSFNAKRNTGGANGSVRLELGAAPNKGIKFAVDLCEQVKVKHPKITHADLFQLAGMVAVEATGGPVIQFTPGRTDATKPDSNGGIPNPNGDAKHLRDIFEKMGFSDQEIVALSGSHTLGRAHQDRSGFDGPFTRDPLKFDNSYYIELRKGNTPGLVKFPTDTTLTQDPEFRKFVELYAKDEKKFFEDYAEAHKKMSELGLHPPTMMQTMTNLICCPCFD